MSNSDSRSHIEFLDDLNETALPAFIESLPAEQLAELRGYVEEIVARKTAGLDKFFASAAQTTKFIPNFILHGLIKNYIEPPIAARISDHMTVKEVVGVASGLPPDYVGEVAIYSKSELSAAILPALPARLLGPVVRHVQEHRPLKLLEVVAHSKDADLKRLLPFLEPAVFAGLDVRAPDHVRSLERLRALMMEQA